MRPCPEQPGGAREPRPTSPRTQTLLLPALREELPRQQGADAARPGPQERQDPRLRSVREGFRLSLRPHQTSPDGARKSEAFHLPDVRERLLHEARRGGSRQGPHGRETVPLSVLPQELQTEGGAQRAPQMAQRGEEALVFLLREGLPGLQQPKETQVHSHRGETSLLSPVHQDLHSVRPPEETLKERAQSEMRFRGILFLFSIFCCMTLSYANVIYII